MQTHTAQHLQNQKKRLWESLDKNLIRHKQELMDENARRADNDEDFTKVEKTLKDRLETMTQMAQQIDDDNRGLMKTNQELKISYLSQVDDRDLLLKQIIYHKKQS